MTQWILSARDRSRVLVAARATGSEPRRGLGANDRCATYIPNSPPRPPSRHSLASPMTARLFQAARARFVRIWNVCCGVARIVANTCRINDSGTSSWNRSLIELTKIVLRAVSRLGRSNVSSCSVQGETTPILRVAHCVRILRQSLGVTVLATRTNLCATRRWVPRRFGPLNFGRCQHRRSLGNTTTTSSGIVLVLIGDSGRTRAGDGAASAQHLKCFFVVRQSVRRAEIVFIVDRLHRCFLTGVAPHKFGFEVVEGRLHSSARAPARSGSTYSKLATPCGLEGSRQP